MPEPESPRHPATSAVLVVSAIVLFVGACLTISLVREEDTPLTRWLTDAVRHYFPGDEGAVPETTLTPGNEPPAAGSD